MKVDMPPLSQVNVTFRRAPRSQARSKDVQLPLNLVSDDEPDAMDEDEE